jgi:hypothetical protein
MDMLTTWSTSSCVDHAVAGDRRAEMTHRNHAADHHLEKGSHIHV